MADRVRGAGISATWFATHGSPILRDLADDATQEVGIHPNFFPGSTQGDTMEEIVDGLLSIYPNASGVRAHALLDSTRHQQYYARKGIKYVSNVIMWNVPSKPFFQPWTGLWQIPISWEDDVACGYAEDVCFLPPEGSYESLFVLNFHPLYCYLNERSGMRAYRKLKDRYARFRDVSKDVVSSLALSGEGLSKTLDTVLGQMKGSKWLTLDKIYQNARSGQGRHTGKQGAR
jgi:hypothetical protein